MEQLLWWRLCWNKSASRSSTLDGTESARREDCLLEELRLYNCGLGDEGVSMIAEALECNATLKEIDLMKTAFQVAGAKALGRMLQKNTCLLKLTICVNFLTQEGSKAICEAMQSNHSITALSMSHQKQELYDVAAMLRATRGVGQTCQRKELRGAERF